MAIGLKNTGRILLTGQELEIGFADVRGNPYRYRMAVDRCLGEGSSCICYEVTIHKNEGDLGQKRILKQFYPLPLQNELDTDMQGMRLEIAGYTDDPETTQHPEITRLGDAFEEAFRRQVELSNEDDIYQFIVRPDLCFFDGATKYVLYEPDYGATLDFTNSRTVEDFLEKMYRLAYALQQLHRRGLVYMDLKPANILVSAGGEIKLIDLDAVLDTKDIGNVHLYRGDLRYDMSDRRLIAPEIRPERLGEFEQNKEFFVNHRVDIYSFGALMLSFFLGRYPTEDDCSHAAFRPEIEELFRTGAFRGELTQEGQDQLTQIIWKCVQEDLSPYGRYTQTEDLVRDLDSLRKLAAAPAAKRKRTYTRTGGRLQAASVMDRNPACAYRVRKEEGRWSLDTLILGGDPISEAFITNLLSCAQMLDTKLVVRIVLEGAREKLASYLQKWPLMKKACTVRLEDCPVNRKGEPGTGEELIPKMMRDPLAEIRFYEWKKEIPVQEAMQAWENQADISWITVVGTDIDANLPVAEKIAEYMCSAGRHCFIGYLDERGDGFELREPSRSWAGVRMQPFSSSSAYSLDEKKISKGIYRKAFLLHKHYFREWNERAKNNAIWEDFQSEAYNVSSSLCSALSIPYKLSSLGISGSDERAARAYWDMVLSTDGSGSEEAKNRLLCLEHRRWMGFMMTEGYDSAGEKYKHYAFVGPNDQRNKAEKLHICICESGEGGIMLDKFPHDLWEEPDIKTAAEQKGISLDPLDVMSVKFHQFCGRKIAAMEEDGIFESAFQRLEQALKNERVLSDEVADLVRSLRLIHARMLDNESNINRAWDRACQAFGDTIRPLKAKFKTGTEEVFHAFRELKNLTRIVVERNSYHDYKSSDRTILEAIPLLMLSDQPVRRIHKPVAGQAWQNVASSIIIEPEQLFLYTDTPAESDAALIRSFLEEERGISTDVRIRSMEELRNLKVTDKSVKSVLDITGLSVEEAYALARLENLEKIPVITFRDGKIHSLREKTDADFYSVLRRHLTVRETFLLQHSYIHSEESQNYMLGLADSYDKIWESYIRIGGRQYKTLVEVLHQIEENNYWKLDMAQEEEVQSLSLRNVAGRMLQDAGIDRVLDNLKKDKWTGENSTYPKAGQIGRLTVFTRYGSVLDAVKRMIACAMRNPYMHRFLYVKTRREPLTEKVLAENSFYIYDDTMLVDQTLPDQEINAKQHEKTSDIVGRALDILGEHMSMTGEGTIIRAKDRDGFVRVQPIEEGKPPKYEIRFLYRNRSVKECLLKEGNALEAYVYHSLWKNALVDDIKLNVAFTWDATDSQEALEPDVITNEIDLVCTCNMQTFFISCKQAMPTKDHLQEIKFFADHFGVDGKAILVTSNWQTSTRGDIKGAARLSSRAQKMGVYYIDRSMIGEGISDMREGKLPAYMQRIFNRDRDWKEES